MQDVTNWLLVERFENWNIDQKNGFTYFGLSDKLTKRASQIKVGDRLFVYVSGKSCFSDIRISTKNGVRPLRMGGDYIDTFQMCIDTKPLFGLRCGRWIPFSQLRYKLSFTKHLSDCRQIFRNSLRLLDDSDASIIETALRENADDE